MVRLQALGENVDRLSGTPRGGGVGRLCPVSGCDRAGAERAQCAAEQHSRLVSAKGIAILAIEVAGISGRMRVLALLGFGDVAGACAEISVNDRYRHDQASPRG